MDIVLELVYDNAHKEVFTGDSAVSKLKSLDPEILISDLYIDNVEFEDTFVMVYYKGEYALCIVTIDTDGCYLSMSNKETVNALYNMVKHDTSECSKLLIEVDFRKQKKQNIVTFDEDVDNYDISI